MWFQDKETGVATWKRGVRVGPAVTAVSIARLVITAVVVQGRSQAEVARTYKVSKGWVSKLVARYRAEGEAAFEPRSRRPARSPTATPETVVELVLEHRKSRVAGGPGRRPGDVGVDPRTPSPIRVSARPSGGSCAAPGPWTPTARAPLVVHPFADQPTSAGKPTSPTSAWPTAPTSKSSLLATTPLPHLGHRHRRVTGPIVVAAFRQACATTGSHPPSPTTAWCSPPACQVAVAQGFGPTRHLGVTQKNSDPTPRHLRQGHLQQTMKLGSPPDHPHHDRAPRSATASSTSTTTSAPPLPTRPPPRRRLATRPKPHPPRHDRHHPRHRDQPASPCATTAPPPHRPQPNPRPNPVLSSSTTSTSASSTPPPASSTATSPSTPPDQPSTTGTPTPKQQQPQ
ncbi:MAG: helix-turn-helix domain-containing protein [Actinomycetota bacterium]|nr:MAG: helix-turn-helix domain-containing protein [Actinomycetota bacterium]